MSAVDHVPLPRPPLPQDATRPGELTAGQEEMYAKMLAHFDKPDYALPRAEKGALSEEEQFWLSRECILRYLRATKWHLDPAIVRLEDTLRWRREFGLYDFAPADVEPEAVTGKEIVFGYDTQRRPALYMVPSRQNTDESPRQIQYAVWMLERTLDLAGPGIESIVLMINFADRAKNPSLGTSKTVLNILQSHYPERLGAALILNVPFLINAFFKLISPFIDPLTRTKMKFNPRPVEDGLFDAAQLMKDGGWGGDCEFVWDHGKYWPALLKMCAEIREAQRERWKALGGKVGISEWDFKRDTADAKVGEGETRGEAADVFAKDAPAEVGAAV